MLLWYYLTICAKHTHTLMAMMLTHLKQFVFSAMLDMWTEGVGDQTANSLPTGLRNVVIHAPQLHGNSSYSTYVKSTFFSLININM